ncbi:MAG: hypothetical protein ABR615_08590, partial [Pseudonocardiaceae bacterium]
AAGVDSRSGRTEPALLQLLPLEGALRRAGVPKPKRAEGFHALRHFYASVLLDGRESIKARSEYLGHADPGFTLRTYMHLMPSSAERTHRAVDSVFQLGAPAHAEGGNPYPRARAPVLRRPGDGMIMDPEPKTAGPREFTDQTS